MLESKERGDGVRERSELVLFTSNIQCIMYAGVGVRHSHVISLV